MSTSRSFLIGLLCLLAAGCASRFTEPGDICVHAAREKERFRAGCLPYEDRSLYYETEGDGPALVLIHGAAPHGIFHPTFSRFADMATLVYYDQHGYGLTGARDMQRWTTAKDVEDLEALRARLKLEKMTLLVVSYGGPIALSYALKYPHRIAKLILVSSFADNDDRIPEAQVMVARILYEDGVAKKMKAIEDDPSLAEREKTIRKWLLTPGTHHHSPIPGEVVELWYDCGVFPEQSKDRSTCSIPEAVTWGDLQRIEAPVLVLSGRHDAITPLDLSRRMAENLPRGRLVIFEKSGHLPWIEEEELFFDTVKEFLMGE